MPTHHPRIPAAPQPTRIFFDPFNPSSTGHQRAEDRASGGSTRWREVRAQKLRAQFADATGGGGDGGDWDGGAPPSWPDTRGMLDRPDSRKRTGRDLDLGGGDDEPKKKKRAVSQPESGRASGSGEQPHALPPPLPQIFRGLTMYLNGSTMPLVSDHRLKQLFAQHGGAISLALRRRTVTHVVLGERPAGGGGLAAAKIQKEAAGRGSGSGSGSGVKYVSARWVLDSVDKGVRQPEFKYAVETGVRGGSSGGLRGVAALFKAKTV